MSAPEAQRPLPPIPKRGSGPPSTPRQSWVGVVRQEWKAADKASRRNTVVAGVVIVWAGLLYVSVRLEFDPGPEAASSSLSVPCVALQWDMNNLRQDPKVR